MMQYKRSLSQLAILTFAVFILVACGTSPETLLPKVEPLSPETLLPKAEPLCEAAFFSSVSEDSLVFPIFILLNIEYEDKQWNYAPDILTSSFESPSSSEVQTVACIKETRSRVGTYTDGVPAYRLVWDVRLVQWPGGEAISATELYGSKPPELKDSSESNYGPQPSQELNEWLTSVLAKKMILSHPRSVSSITFSPDGKILASASEADYYTVKLWDVETGQELRTLDGHTGPVISVAFSPDGKTLASGSFDETVKLWNVETGQELRTLNWHGNRIHGVAFSPDGQTLASTSFAGVMLWDMATEQELRSFSQGRIAFSPDGKTLALGSRFKVELWDTSKWAVVRTFSGEGLAMSLAFSSDGKILASGNSDGGTVLWDVGTGKVVKVLGGHETTAVTSVTFSPDGTLIAANGYWTVRLWDVVTGQEVRTFRHTPNEVNSIAFSPDGETLAAGWSDGTVVLWDIATEP